MPNIAVDVSGIYSKASQLKSIQSMFQNCDDRMQNVKRTMEEARGVNYGGVAAETFLERLSSYSRDLSKTNEVLGILSESTLKSGQILEEAQKEAASSLFHSSISSTSQGAASGNFVDSNKIYKESFQDVTFTDMGNGTYRMSNNGVDVGFTNEAGYSAYETLNTASNK